MKCNAPTIMIRDGKEGRAQVVDSGNARSLKVVGCEPGTDRTNVSDPYTYAIDQLPSVLLTFTSSI